jgi:hypothetical protein
MVSFKLKGTPENRGNFATGGREVVMNKFVFNANYDQDQNINEFIQYMKSVDQELGELMIKHIPSIERLPIMTQAQKNNFRNVLSGEVINIVDKGTQK